MAAKRDPVYINTPFGVPLGTSLVQQPFGDGYRTVQGNIAAQTAAGGAAATHPSVFAQAQALGQQTFESAGLPFQPALSVQPFNNMSAMFYASGVRGAQLLYYPGHAGSFAYLRDVSAQNLKGANVSIDPPDPIITTLGLEDRHFRGRMQTDGTRPRQQLYMNVLLERNQLLTKLIGEQEVRFNEKYPHKTEQIWAHKFEDINAYDALYYTQRAFGAKEPHAYMPFIAYQQYTQAYPNVDLELFGNTMATYARQLMRLSEENNLKYFVPEQRLQAGTYSNIDYVDLLKEHGVLEQELHRQGIPLSSTGPFASQSFGPVTAYDFPVRVYNRAEGILEDVEQFVKFDYFHGDSKTVRRALAVPANKQLQTYEFLDPKGKNELVKKQEEIEEKLRAHRAEQRAQDTAPQGDLSGLRALSLVGSHRANAQSQVAVPVPVINPAPSQVASSAPSQVAVPAPVASSAPSQVAAPPAPPSGGGGGVGGGGSSSSSGGGGGEPPRKRPKRVAREAQSAVAAVAAVTSTAEEISTPATRAAAAATSRGEAPPAVLPAADFITEPRARVVFESEDSVAIRNHELEQARLADAQRQREHELEVQRIQAQSVQLTVAGQTEVAQLQLTQQTKAGEAAAAAQEAQRILAAEAAGHQQAQIAKQAEADISVAQAVEAAKTQSYQQRYDFTASRREEAAAKREAKSDARRQRQKKERLIESINDRFIAHRGEAFAPAAELMLEPMDKLQGIAQNIKIEEREQRVAQQQARVEERQARAEERAEAARVKAEEKAEKERERAQAKAEKDRVKREREFDRDDAQRERQQEREQAKILSLERQLELKGVSDDVIAEAMLEGGSTGLQALMHQVKLDAQDAKEQAQLEKGMFLAPRFREAALAGGFYTQDATGRFRFVQTGRGSFIGGFSGGLFGGQARETDPLATKEGYLAGQRAVIAAQALNIGGGALVGGAIGYASAGVTGAVVGGLMGGKAGLLGLAQQGIAMARGAGASDFFGAIGAFNADVSKYMQLHYDVATQAANVELPANHFRYAIARSRSTDRYYSQSAAADPTALISARVGIAPEKAIQVLSGVAQALPFGFNEEGFLGTPTKSGALAELMLRGYDPVRMAQTQSAYGLYAGGVTSGQRNIQRVLTAYEATLAGESQRSINQIQMLMDQTYQGAQARELKGLSSMSPVRYAQHVRAGGAGREALTMSVMSKSEDLGISVASAGLAPLEGSAQQLMFAYAMQRTGGDVSRAAEYARNMRGGEQLGAFTAMGVSANVRGMMLQAAGLSLKEQGALGRAFSKKHLDAAGQPEAEVLSAPADDKSMAVATATSAASRTAVASTYGSDPDKMIDRLNAIVSAMNTFTRQVTTNGLSAKDVRELNSALSSLGGQIREMNKNFVKFVVPKISAVGSAVLPAAQTE